MLINRFHLREFINKCLAVRYGCGPSSRFGARPLFGSGELFRMQGMRTPGRRDPLLSLAIHFRDVQQSDEFGPHKRPSLGCVEKFSYRNPPGRLYKLKAY